MASSSGASSGSANGGIRTSGSEDDQEAERKRRRMQSNRESARRSRLRKQKHLDDLTDQVNRLKKHNNEMVANMNVATNLYVSLEVENSILRTQMLELTYRLQSLNDIVMFINSMEVFETFSFEVDDLNNGFEEEDYYYNP
ncbi:bZIP transcription factor 44-like isoform X2 [Benincasa hispida]|uniref:bZIP transcription factor 44-like isoform X2 n=1 Tax=Benincasa hispida TaxID=102211 RepID=UPI00190278C5|nr:bZIP transcription factor 44-like isoform X2 [Benincasa hispida]